MLGIVIVDYKSSRETIRFVKEQLRKIKDYPYKIFITNNVATEESNNLFRDKINAELVIDCNFDKNKDIYILPVNENLGFAKGNNLAAEFISKNFDCEYLLFTNNDIIIDSPDIICKLIHNLESNPEIGMIGPQIIGLDNNRQSPEPYQTLWKRHVWMYLATPFLSKRQKQQIFNLNYSENAAEGFHYKIMGSFFMMRTSDYLNCGMMDSNTFLYAEEPILSERLKRLNKKVYFYPSVTVIHAHGSTTSKHLDSVKKRLLQFDSEAYYYSKYKGYSDFSIKLCRFIYSMIIRLKQR